MVLLTNCVITAVRGTWKTTSNLIGAVNNRAVIVRTQRTLPIFSRTLQHADRKVVRAPISVMYNVVADVDKYYEFIPYCTKSVVTSKTNKTAKAKLSIGFGPVQEHYNSTLVLNDPTYVKSICTEGKLFNLLDCTWKFAPGPQPDTCIVNFHIIFEFRSLMYTKLANMFFNEVVKKMVTSFESRAMAQQKKVDNVINDDVC
uniref:Coenzyme Q-binding protein COQ10 homolog A, mitochondrial-like n=1 Tax=Phallusia mammillata TaxID=59560 RepID=A0A6F9DAL9_9ASCI|nr:coenzyme Q-binding protein COQ10 homolog A, mitochondrial-like [Phallusia mammillata]